MLHPDTSVMQEMSRRIEEYEMGKDISEIRDTAKNTMFEMERGLEREKECWKKRKKMWKIICQKRGRNLPSGRAGKTRSRNGRTV